MPPFPERESSLLAKLKKKKGAVDKDEKELEPPAPAAQPATPAPQPVSHTIIFSAQGKNWKMFWVFVLCNLLKNELISRNCCE